MHITRLNHAREISKRADIIRVELSNGKSYDITEYFGSIKILQPDGNKLTISPIGSVNGISISCED